ncbi:MAG: glycosyltransferase family 4 protein [Thermodesulfobacteriota bacterium]
MKILMIAPEPFFEPRGTPISVLGRLKALSSLGHEVDLLTYHVGNDVVIPGIKIYRTPSIRLIKEVPVGPSWIKILLDILLFVKAFRMILSERYDILHTHEEASFLGAVIAKIFKVRHLYDFHSSIPQTLKSFGYHRFPLLIPFFEWLERQVICSSNAIIVISPALADYVKKINKKIPLVTIENTTEVIDPKSISEEKIQKLKLVNPQLDGKKIVLYTGTFEPYQGIDLLISSAVFVLKGRNDVIFVLVGGKLKQVKGYKEDVVKLGLASHFLFTGVRPPEEIPVFMKIADVLVSPRIEGNNTPLKIYGFLKSGKPIVATKNTSHTQILNPEVAVLVEQEPESFGLGILSVLENPSLAREVGEKARIYFEERYNYQSFVRQTEQILQAVMM